MLYHGPSLCLAFAGVRTNHLVHSIYSSFSLIVEEDCFCFFSFGLFSSTILLWCIVLSRTAFSLFSHITYPGHAAVEPNFSAVDLSGPESLNDWRNVWLVMSQNSPNSQTLFQAMLCKRHTGKDIVSGDVATCI